MQNTRPAVGIVVEIPQQAQGLSQGARNCNGEPDPRNGKVIKSDGKRWRGNRPKKNGT